MGNSKGKNEKIDSEYKSKESLILDIKKTLDTKNYPFIIGENFYYENSRKDYKLNKEIDNFLEKNLNLSSSVRKKIV